MVVQGKISWRDIKMVGSERHKLNIIKKKYNKSNFKKKKITI